MAGRVDQGPGQFLDGTWKSMLERSRQKRTKLATQTWPEFFKGFAIEVAAMVIVVGIVAIIVALVH
jgi:uncharacterized protein (DUF4213/DUF364 family)